MSADAEKAIEIAAEVAESSPLAPLAKDAPLVAQVTVGLLLRSAPFTRLTDRLAGTLQAQAHTQGCTERKRWWAKSAAHAMGSVTHARTHARTHALVRTPRERRRPGACEQARVRGPS